jgi:hypothetical protein
MELLKFSAGSRRGVGGTCEPSAKVTGSDLWLGVVTPERSATRRERTRRNALSLYELRTCSLYVGKLAEARELYRSEGWPALGKHAEGRLVSYFIGAVGATNQIVHLWKVADDAGKNAP